MTLEEAQKILESQVVPYVETPYVPRQQKEMTEEEIQIFHGRQPAKVSESPEASVVQEVQEPPQ